MEERVFLDKHIKPTEEALQASLGNVYEQYKKVNEITSAYKKDWTFTKTSGWMSKVFDANKALFYIIPLKYEFKISMAIRENERDIFLGQESLNIYHERLQAAKKYIEGYSVQFLITNEADYIDVETLLEILMSLRS